MANVESVMSRRARMAPLSPWRYATFIIDIYGERERCYARYSKREIEEKERQARRRDARRRHTARLPPPPVVRLQALWRSSNSYGWLLRER